MKHVTEDIFYLGANNLRERTFEGEIPLKRGMSYNSYLIKDNITILLDTTEPELEENFLTALNKALDGRKLDYLIVQHVEPDHTGGIKKVCELHPEVTIYISMLGEKMLKQFYPDIKNKIVNINDSSTLVSDHHELIFKSAPMVHWPEVMVTYDKASKTLFSADAFGSFTVFYELDSSEYSDKKELIDESRRYYANIVGKYGQQVQMLFTKLASLDIKRICSLHGPIHTTLIPEYLRLYNLWSKYEPERKGILLVVGSMYGNTLKAIKVLQEMIKDQGVEVELLNLAKVGVSKAISRSFMYKNIVLATPTYNTKIFPLMANYLFMFNTMMISNKKIALVGNGSWSYNACDVMRDYLKDSKNEIVDKSIMIKSTYTKETEEEFKELIKELMA